ncbi:MAG: chemotaxis protein CheX [Verrucomicrobia bacterium]|nr:chemotaxis protein CheX [Verrucomicrobiota bacterium]
MNSLELVDLEDIANQTISTIFSEMVGMGALRLPAHETDFPEVDQVVSTIDLAGTCPGIITVSSDRKLAFEVASIMMGTAPESLSNLDVLDVIGELNNMIVGNLKTVMGNIGIECKLRTPSVALASKRPYPICRKTAPDASGFKIVAYSISTSYLVTYIKFEKEETLYLDLESATRGDSENLTTSATNDDLSF